MHKSTHSRMIKLSDRLIYDFTASDWLICIKGNSLLTGFPANYLQKRVHLAGQTHGNYSRYHGSIAGKR